MDDVTTIDHGREEFRRAPGERPGRWIGDTPDETRRSPSETVDDRSTESVPSGVTCQQCGRPTESFPWFQRVPEGDVDGQRPERDLFFCGIVCLSLYCRERYEGYRPTTVAYDE